MQAPAGTASSDEDTPVTKAAPVAAAKPAPAPVVEADDGFDDDDAATPVASAPVSKPAASGSAQDILALIRSRQKT
jgi:hypothetical protein